MPDLRPDYIAPENEHLYPALGKPYRDFVADDSFDSDPGNVKKDPKRPVDPRDNRFLKGAEEAWRAYWELPAEEFTPAASMAEWQARLAATQEAPAPPAPAKK